MPPDPDLPPTRVLAVARTSGGRSHWNTIVVGPVFELVLEAAQSREELHDHFQLKSDDGRYERTLSREEAVPVGDGRLLLAFTGLPRGARFELIHWLRPDRSLLMFQNVPFASLTRHGDETQAPRTRRATPPAEPPPVGDPWTNPMILDLADAADEDSNSDRPPDAPADPT